MFLKARCERQKTTLGEEVLKYKDKVNASNHQIENWLQQIQEKKRVSVSVTCQPKQYDATSVY